MSIDSEKIIQAKSAKSIVILSFLAVLSYFLPGYVLDLIFFKTFNPVPFLLILLLKFLSYLLPSVFAYFILLQMKKTFDGYDERPKFEKMAMLGNLLLNLFILLVFTTLYQYLPYISSFLPSLPFVGAGNPYIDISLALLQVIVCILGAYSIVVSNSIAIYSGSTPFNQISILVKAKFYLFRQFKHAVSILLRAFLLVLPLFVFLSFLDHFLRDLSLSYFLMKSILFIVPSICISIALVTLLAHAFSKVSSTPEAFPSLLEKVNSSTLGIFLAIIVTLQYLSLPPNPSTLERLKKAVSQELALGEKTKNENLYKSALHYERAYNLSKASKEAINLILALKDDAIGKEGRDKLVNQSLERIKPIIDRKDSLGYLFYLDTLIRSFSENHQEKMENLYATFSLEPSFSNAGFQLAQTLDKDLSHRDKVLYKPQYDLLDKNFKNTALLYKCKELTDERKGKLTDAIKFFDDSIEKARNMLPLKAMNLYENKLYEEALAQIKELQKDLPDNLTVNYLTAIIDLETKRDNKDYQVAMDAANNILKNYPNEKWALDFRAEVALLGGKLSELEKALEEEYSKVPNDPDVAEKYAYSLMKKNRNFDYQDSDRKAFEILNKLLKGNPDRWFATYCTAVLKLKDKKFDQSLEDIKKFSLLAGNRKDLFATFDDFYYLYVLKYKTFLEGQSPEASAALDKIKDTDAFTYNYILGAHSWGQKKFEDGLGYLTKTIELNESLSKPYYLLGNVYNENAMTKKDNALFSKALSYYNTAASIFPDDPYCWFSIGHVYKKLDNLEAALGAFQKTLNYMPEEDHNEDHFGVSIHAKMQIDEIKNKLSKN